MNETVRQKKEELMEAIRRSEECRQFCLCKEKMMTQPEKRKELDSFRSRAFLLQSSPVGEETRREEEELLSEQTRLMKDPSIAAYLKAEQAYCRMLRELCFDVLRVTDFEIDDFISCISL